VAAISISSGEPTVHLMIVLYTVASLAFLRSMSRACFLLPDIPEELVRPMNHRGSRRRAFKGSGVPRVTDSVADFIYTEDELWGLQAFY
jgi:hypothetical protein